jgi:hypothetical protein
MMKSLWAVCFLLACALAAMTPLLAMAPFSLGR